MSLSNRAKIYEELKDRRRRGQVKDAKAIVETLTEIGTRELIRKGVFLIPGFAKFVVIKKPANKVRKGTTPSTGEEMTFTIQPAQKAVRVLSAKSQGARRKTGTSNIDRRKGPALPEPLYVLEIGALADRVFGDEKKASAWLTSPNASLSGQKPAELLADELGAAVVRETLLRIDHGIFA